MDHFLDAIAAAVSLTQLGTVALLLFYGAVRKYGFVLTYCMVQLCTSLGEVVVERRFGARSWQYRELFWTDELVMDLLLFLILILLTYRAMEGSPARATTGRILSAVAFLAVFLPLVLFKGAFKSFAWFDHTSQLLNFSGAVLNLGLWTALLGSRKKDFQLMTVSAGFGIVATGAAISFGLRRMIQTPGPAHEAANLVFVLAQLAGALILCWAFRPVRKEKATLALPENISNGVFLP